MRTSRVHQVGTRPEFDHLHSNFISCSTSPLWDFQVYFRVWWSNVESHFAHLLTSACREMRVSMGTVANEVRAK